MAVRRMAPWMICGVVAVALLTGCQPGSPPAADSAPGATAAVAVASPYLEAAVRDVFPVAVPLVRLAGPGMCPGHFDMRPSQIGELARCRLLLRFDFQQGLDEKAGAGEGGSLRSLPIKVPGGMCEPQSYLSVCRQVAAHFVAAGELKQAVADDRLARVAQRAAALERSAAAKIDAARLRGAPVLASRHQAAFCRWLGLQVAGDFSGSDTAGTREIDQAVTAGEAAGVGLIVANEPEGRKLADALADRLRAKVVVFGNFPEPGQEHAFDALVERNLAALLAAVPATAKRP